MARVIAKGRDVYFCTKIDGGGEDALDSIDGEYLIPGTMAIVFDVRFGIFMYQLIFTDTAIAESSPAVIAPDNNAGNKRWVMKSWLACHNASGMKFDDQAVDDRANAKHHSGHTYTS